MEPRVKLNRNKSGYALVLAIVVLAALLTLATPFLLTTRSSARSSVARWGDVRARLEIDAAERALWRRLEATDPELDTTPYYDSEDEMRKRLSLPKELYPTREIGGSIVSATADPESARIDINTAGVYGLGLAFGHGLLGSDLKKDETEISLDNGDKFPDKGFLWIRGELIQYTEKKGSQFLGCTRSVMGSPTGPYEVAEDYRSGTPVVDARAHAIAKHRIRAKNGEFKTFSTIYELSRVNVEPDACPKITADDIRNVEARLTAYGERNGHDFWSAYARITSPIAADGIQRVLQIDLPRYFGVGTTVKIEGPEGVEYGLVVKSREDGITLEEPPRFPAAAYTAKISFLIPSPIHINSADPELLEDIFTGIDMERAATPEPVDRAAAKKIVQKIREKPVQSQQDFVDRVLLPLAEDGTLAINNIEAILRSVEHCNDRIVKYGTLPLSYTGGSRFRIVASSSVNAPSGAERGRVENESIVEIHPQARASSDIGLRLAARQVELDELFRLSRRGRGWMTYPYNSTPFDGRANPPSRARAFLNILTQLGESLPSVQSDDPANSWAQLAPSRDAVDPNFSEHFDYDLTIEGHDVRTLKPYRINPLNAPARLTGPGNVYLYPGSVSGWVRFDTGTVTGAIFDIGSGTSLLRDHISLIIDQGDLVATMRDPAGDDTNSLANVAGEVRNEIRYPVSNLQQNVWYHFTIAFKGSGPADWTLLVDGVPRGKRKLVTRLTGKLDGLTAQNIPNNDPIPVESTEGFPQFGVLKIGAELVEYTSITAKSFITTRTFGTSPGAYTGGRGARSSFDININPALYEHAEGETVEFYGYVNKLMRDTQAGGGQLRGTISKFSAGHVSITQPGLKPISIAPPVGGGGGGGGGITLGKGILATDTIPELVLAPLDVLETTGGGQSQDKDFIKAFSTAGGYAVMFQFQNPNTFSDGQTMFGAELIRYSGIDTSKSSLTGVTRAAQGNYFQPRTFVVDWAIGVPGPPPTGGGNQNPHKNDNYHLWVFVVPCSIGVSGGMYEQPPQTLTGGQYIPVQLIEIGAQGVGLDLTTEWINYDTFLNGDLCVLDSARWARVQTLSGNAVTDTQVPGGGIVVFGPYTYPTPPPGCVPVPANYNNIAEPPTSMRPELVRLIEEGGSVSGATVPAPGLSFRGTNNTYSQDHSSTREIIPCFLTYQGSIFAGRPGRNDRMRFLLPQNITTGGLAAFSTINWTSAYSGHEVWVATKEVLPGAVINIEPTRFPETTASVGQFEDSREFTRIAKVPSGELPIEATSVAVGGRYDGPGDEIAGTIDEIEFTSPVILTNRDAIGKLIVNQAFNASATGFTVSPIVPSNPYSAATNPVLDAAALPGFSKSISGRVLSLMPADAGIVMIGEELIGYDNFDAASGQFTVAKNGRGMLGTKATGHGAFETVVFLDHFVVTQLASAATPGSSRLAGEDMQGFPSEGTILIGSELSHYTRIESQSFAMPEFEDDNAVPGESSAGIAIQMKRKGYGIFRGRYGSIPENHAAGEIIFKFPYRYWDRWVAGSDEPELNYIQMDECKDSGFYRRVSWIEELPLPGVTFEAIARLDARSPWTAEANNSDGLWMFTRPQSGEKSNWILRQGSRLEMRLGVRFGLGSFSPIQPPIENATVRNDAWKTTPRLRAIATERFGATKVLWREEHR